MQETKILEALETVTTLAIVSLRRNAIEFHKQGDEELYAAYASATERLEKALELIGVAVNTLSQSQ